MIEITEEMRDAVRLTFHAPPQSYNCAQSVMALTGHEDACGEMAACGGGRAPEGLCGALYAALLQVPAEKRDALKAEFQEAVGALTCRDIKGKGKIPCLECVAVGTALAKKYRE